MFKKKIKTEKIELYYFRATKILKSPNFATSLPWRTLSSTVI